MRFWRRASGGTGNGRVKNGRGGGIRTRDLLVPNQLRYQAALHPEQLSLYAGRTEALMQWGKAGLR